MSITYPHDRTPPHGDTLAPAAAEEPFVPRYARTRKSGGGGRGKIKTWMILAPVGAVVLGGLAAVMLMNGGEETVAPLAEPAATAPVLPAVPLTDAATAPLTSASTPAPVEVAPTPATPAAREAAPLRRAAPAPAPARRVAPRAETPAPAPAVTPRLNTAPAASPTTTLNTAPATPTPAPAPPPAPVIVVEPLN